MHKEMQKLAQEERKSKEQKGTIVAVNPSPDQFVSPMFLVRKEDQGQRAVINFKKLNQFIPYEHFKMKGLFLVKEMLKPGDWMCTLDLKVAYFSVPLDLCFGHSPAPRTFSNRDHS